MPIHAKVVASTSGSVVGGALTVLVVWLLGLGHIVVPSDVASALTVLFGAVLAFAGGWLAPPDPAGPQS
jgi:hypothetical protein